MISAPCCPLCENSGDNTLFHSDRCREYFQCPRCALVFVPVDQHISHEAERAEYDKHQNSPDDLGYRNFLKRLFVPLKERLPQNAAGLDFGCGPGPTLSLMFQEAAHRVTIYDPFYADDTQALGRQYDFITASEVVEHLRNPGRELSRLWSLLKPGGWLGIMTKLVLDRKRFAAWHYIQDPTHISFFSRETFRWQGAHWGCEPGFIGNDVILFQKGETSA